MDGPMVPAAQHSTLPIVLSLCAAGWQFPELECAVQRCRDELGLRSRVPEHHGDFCLVGVVRPALQDVLPAVLAPPPLHHGALNHVAVEALQGWGPAALARQDVRGVGAERDMPQRPLLLALRLSHHGVAAVQGQGLRVQQIALLIEELHAAPAAGDGHAPGRQGVQRSPSSSPHRRLLYGQGHVDAVDPPGRHPPMQVLDECQRVLAYTDAHVAPVHGGRQLREGAAETGHEAHRVVVGVPDAEHALLTTAKHHHACVAQETHTTVRVPMPAGWLPAAVVAAEDAPPSEDHAPGVADNHVAPLRVDGDRSGRALLSVRSTRLPALQPHAKGVAASEHHRVADGVEADELLDANRQGTNNLGGAHLLHIHPLHACMLAFLADGHQQGALLGPAQPEHGLVETDAAQEREALGVPQADLASFRACGNGLQLLRAQRARADRSDLASVRSQRADLLRRPHAEANGRGAARHEEPRALAREGRRVDHEHAAHERAGRAPPIAEADKGFNTCHGHAWPAAGAD
mmetsp:Transcript_45629/g.145611  ORF Transcript_45629/g.145611 Transcript_45629/m.145611 type:complete len:519 (-) Transcript_45629:23-1579(-)